MRDYCDFSLVLSYTRHILVKKVKNFPCLFVLTNNFFPLSHSEHLTTGELNFTVEKCSRQDLLFIRKNSQYFLFNLYESCCIHNNKPRHYNLLTNIVCLLVLEFGQEDYLVELVAFVLGIQVGVL